MLQSLRNLSLWVRWAGSWVWSSARKASPRLSASAASTSKEWKDTPSAPMIRCFFNESYTYTSQRVHPASQVTPAQENL